MRIELPADLLDFVADNSGPDTAYTTPSDFIIAVLAEKKERLEAANIRASIVAGYEDAIAGRVHSYTSDLRHLMRKVAHD